MKFQISIPSTDDNEETTLFIAIPSSMTQYGDSVNLLSIDIISDLLILNIVGRKSQKSYATSFKRD